MNKTGDIFPSRLAEVIAEGKTKVVYGSSKLGYGFFVSKDSITTGDGAKRDIMEGKAALANKTTSNVFRYLNNCGIPTSFIKQSDETSFLGKICSMVPYEVVVRREAHGSYLKGYPNLSKGEVFQTPVVQIFLKTSGKRWKSMALPEDDPLMIIKNGVGLLYNPKFPVAGQVPFVALEEFPLCNHLDVIEDIKQMAVKVFLALEKGWQVISDNKYRLVDFKVEFGFDHEGKLVLADVIDCDSWRVLGQYGNSLSKQSYRNGEPLDKVHVEYQIAAELTNNLPGSGQKRLISSM